MAASATTVTTMSRKGKNNRRKSPSKLEEYEDTYAAVQPFKKRVYFGECDVMSVNYVVYDALGEKEENPCYFGWCDSRGKNDIPCCSESWRKIN